MFEISSSLNTVIAGKKLPLNTSSSPSEWPFLESWLRLYTQDDIGLRIYTEVSRLSSLSSCSFTFSLVSLIMLCKSGNASVFF